jgi:hypothetical protein
VGHPRALAYLVPLTLCSAAFAPVQDTRGKMPVLGACDVKPNYISSPLSGVIVGSPERLLRWESFPVTYSVNTAGLSGSVQQLYADAGDVARDLWGNATGGRVGTLRQVADGGQIQVSFVSSGTVDGAGMTRPVGVGNRITGVTIQIARFPDDTKLIEAGQRRRVLLQTVNTLAHELGHALGITMHSPDDADLMNESGNFFPGRDDRRDPGTFVTAADRNTLLHAYCK